MEEVAVSPTVAGSNGADAVSDDVLPSVISVEETDGHKTNGDVTTLTTIAAINTDDKGLDNVESTKNGDHGTMSECATPVSRSPFTRKKRGAFSLFRAMFMSFGGSDSMKKTDYATSPRKKPIAAADEGDGNPAADSPSWKSLVDGVRPLRLRGHDEEYYPPPPPLGHADVYHDVLLPPPSPARSGFGFEEVGMTSRYASAQDLHQMDCGDEEEDVTAAEGGGGGDGDGGCTPHAIDMQAEEFIAKFYEQFTSESFDGGASE